MDTVYRHCMQTLHIVFIDTVWTLSILSEKNAAQSYL